MEVLYEDNHIIIIYKEADEIVQDDKTGDKSLSKIVKRWIKEKYQKLGSVFLGAVHRPDHPIVGLIVFAGTSKALTGLNDVFRSDEVHKTYWAIVTRPPPETEATLTDWSVYDECQNKSYTYNYQIPTSKKPILRCRVINQSERYTPLEVDLMTGHHYQIRCQLFNTDHPIKGDLKYGTPRSNPDGSICLLSHRVEFIHPISKEKICIGSSLPKDNSWQAMGKL